MWSASIYLEQNEFADSECELVHLQPFWEQDQVNHSESKNNSVKWPKRKK